MAKNKKIKKAEETKAEEQPKTATSSNAITYNGSVKVMIKKGSKVISSSTYHNNGGQQLFYFLLNCIGGNYSENAQPKFIRLFKCTDTASPATAISALSDASSSFIAINKSALLQEDNNWKLTLHFTIPCSYITGDEINQVGLYCSSKLDDSLKTDYSAYYNFIKLENEGYSWDPIRVASKSGDYNVFIEWTMSFKN